MNEEEGIFSGLGNLGNFKGLNSSFGTLGGLANIGTSIYGIFQANKALKVQKDSLNEAKRQNAIDNARWDKREAERVAANETIANSANTWNSPMTRD